MFLSHSEGPLIFFSKHTLPETQAAQSIRSTPIADQYIRIAHPYIISSLEV